MKAPLLSFVCKFFISHSCCYTFFMKRVSTNGTKESKRFTNERTLLFTMNVRSGGALLVWISVLSKMELETITADQSSSLKAWAGTHVSLCHWQRPSTSTPYDFSLVLYLTNLLALSFHKYASLTAGVWLARLAMSKEIFSMHYAKRPKTCFDRFTILLSCCLPLAGRGRSHLWI